MKKISIIIPVYNESDSILKLIINSKPGNYCERVIPDPIPNSEVKPFCADGTLSYDTGE